MDQLDNKTIFLFGLIVRDVETTARNYARIFGVPMPEIGTVAKSAFANVRYRGQPTEGYGKSAFFDMGSVHIEMIEPVGGPSVWDEMLRTRGEGIHHFAIKTDHFEEAVNMLGEQGIPVIQFGGWEEGRYAYMDSAAQLGTIFELLDWRK